jgi:hypothetical protein
MRERLKRLSAVAAVVLVTGSALVGCSDDEGGGSGPGKTLTQAAFFDEISAAQRKAGSSHVVMTVKAGGQTIKADGDLSIGDEPADTAMAMTMDAGQAGLGSLEMRLVDQVFYLNFGPMTSNKFAKIDLADEDNPIGQQYGELIGNVDPAQQLEELEGAVKSFEQKGQPRELDGVQARPYVVVIDTSKVPAAKEARGSLPKTLQYTLYVGPDDLPRRMTSDLPGAGNATMTIDYSQWGEKVSIVEPKPSEITDKDFLGQLGSPTPGS